MQDPAVVDKDRVSFLPLVSVLVLGLCRVSRKIFYEFSGFCSGPMINPDCDV